MAVPDSERWNLAVADEPPHVYAGHLRELCCFRDGEEFGFTRFLHTFTVTAFISLELTVPQS